MNTETQEIVRPNWSRPPTKLLQQQALDLYEKIAAEDARRVRAAATLRKLRELKISIMSQRA